MKDNVEQRIVAIFLVMLVILAGVAYVAVRNLKAAVASNDWVEHTYAVIQEANAIPSDLHAGDSALRTYLITGDQREQDACMT